MNHLWFTAGDSQLVAHTFGDRLRMWDIATGATLSAVVLTDPPIAVSGDGTRVVTARWGGSSASLRRTSDGREVLRMFHPDKLLAAAFDPGGSGVTTVAHSKVWRWPPPSPPAVVALGAAADSLLEAGSGQRAVERITAEVRGKTVIAAVPCPDGNRVAVTRGSSTRAGWRARTDILTMPGGEPVRSFDLMATLGPGLRGLHDRDAGLLACSADGRLIALPASAAIVVVDIAGGSVVARLQHPGLKAIALAPGGDYAATAGAGPVRIWQLSDSAEVARLLGADPVATIAFSDDGRHLATAGPDGISTFLWQPRDLVAEACERLQWTMKPDRWQALFPEAVYVATCAEAR